MDDGGMINVTKISQISVVVLYGESLETNGNKTYIFQILWL